MYYTQPGVSSGLLAFTGLISSVSLLLFVVQAFAFFMLGRKARVSYAWMSFIPLLQVFVILAIIRRSAWNVLWLLVPLVDVVLAIIWYVRLFRAFGQNPWWLLLLLVPGVNGLFMIVFTSYMAFSPDIYYDPSAL